MKALSVVSLLLSSLALIVSASCISHSEYPMVSLLVSILSILVTFLVGWQIYATFVTRSDMKDFKKDFGVLKAKCTNQINESEKYLVKLCDNNFLILRKEMYRDIDALGSCIMLRLSHGPVALLNFACDNVKVDNDYGGFLCRMFAEAAEGAVSDLISEYIFKRDERIFGELVEAIPHDKLCRLYSLDFKTAGWDDARVAQFKRGLDIISSKYPGPSHE